MRHLFRVCASDPITNCSSDAAISGLDPSMIAFPEGTIGEDAPTRVFYFFEA
ncbi:MULTISPECIES: hypothetical protein [Aminobacterium]|jgi:hypothetical protein|uniref:hypothetical protein n=1 Tax=Aminobacterium TaxID=81466 RepID=UPI002580F279|nr:MULTISPECIES: hypothetical protein [unclassified Aminobacterium]